MNTMKHFPLVSGERIESVLPIDAIGDGFKTRNFKMDLKSSRGGDCKHCDSVSFYTNDTKVGICCKYHLMASGNIPDTAICMAQEVEHRENTAAREEQTGYGSW